MRETDRTVLLQHLYEYIVTTDVVSSTLSVLSQLYGREAARLHDLVEEYQIDNCINISRMVIDTFAKTSHTKRVVREPQPYMTEGWMPIPELCDAAIQTKINDFVGAIYGDFGNPE